MTWTFRPEEIAASTLFQVRSLIGDVQMDQQQLTDEEINFWLSQRGSIYGAAAEACRALAARYARRANTAVQGMSITFSDQSRAYNVMASKFDARASSLGAVPYAGGISVSDKQAVEADSDRVTPNYEIGMNDNLTVPGGTNVTQSLEDDL